MILPTVTVSNNLIRICSVLLLYPRRVFLRRRLVVHALLTCLNALLCNLDGGFGLVWFDSTEPLEFNLLPTYNNYISFLLPVTVQFLNHRANLSKKPSTKHDANSTQTHEFKCIVTCKFNLLVDVRSSAG